MSELEGKYILHKRPPRIARQNYLLSLLRHGAFVFFLITAIISVGFVYIQEYEAAATVFVFSMGITGYVLNTIISRQLILNEITDRTLGLLRDRWDALRNDEDLLRLLCHVKEDKDLSPEEKLKLRLFLSTFIDIYILIIRYIRYGYFNPDTEIELAKVFETMIKTLFRYPYMIDIWKSTDKFGKGCLRDEYSGTILYVVDSIIAEIENETQGSSSEPIALLDSQRVLEQQAEQRALGGGPTSASA